MYLVIAEVESEFLPWLLDEAEKTLDDQILARTLLDGKYESMFKLKGLTLEVRISFGMAWEWGGGWGVKSKA